MSSPLFKVVELVVKQLSKPISAQVKRFAVSNETFRHLCVGFAQRWHRFQTQTTVRVAGHNAVAIKPLDEAKAIHLGADVLAEGAIFAVMLGIAYAGYEYSSRVEAQKERQLNHRLSEIETQVFLLQRDMIELMKHNQMPEQMVSDRQRQMDEGQRSLLHRATRVLSFEYWRNALGFGSSAQPAASAASPAPLPSAAVGVALPPPRFARAPPPAVAAAPGAGIDRPAGRTEADATPAAAGTVVRAASVARAQARAAALAALNEPELAIPPAAQQAVAAVRLLVVRPVGGALMAAAEGIARLTAMGRRPAA